MPLKIIFRFSFIVWLILSVVLSVYFLAVQAELFWIGVLVAGLAPLGNKVVTYDTRISPHHKVKLPKVSLLVLCGFALVLLTVPERGIGLWLVLGCVGGFLLDTYWAKDSARSC